MVGLLRVVLLGALLVATQAERAPIDDILRRAQEDIIGAKPKEAPLQAQAASVPPPVTPAAPQRAPVVTAPGTTIVHDTGSFTATPIYDATPVLLFNVSQPMNEPDAIVGDGPAPQASTLLSPVLSAPGSIPAAASSTSSAPAAAVQSSSSAPQPLGAPPAKSSLPFGAAPSNDPTLPFVPKKFKVSDSGLQSRHKDLMANITAIGTEYNALNTEAGRIKSQSASAGNDIAKARALKTAAEAQQRRAVAAERRAAALLDRVRAYNVSVTAKQMELRAVQKQIDQERARLAAAERLHTSQDKARLAAAGKELSLVHAETNRLRTLLAQQQGALTHAVRALRSPARAPMIRATPKQQLRRENKDAVRQVRVQQRAKKLATSTRRIVVGAKNKVNALTKRVNSQVFKRLPPKQMRQLNASVAAVRARHQAIEQRIALVNKKLQSELRVQKKIHNKIVGRIRNRAVAQKAGHSLLLKALAILTSKDRLKLSGKAADFVSTAVDQLTKNGAVLPTRDVELLAKIVRKLDNALSSLEKGRVDATLVRRVSRAEKGAKKFEKIQLAATPTVQPKLISRLERKVARLQHEVNILRGKKSKPLHRNVTIRVKLPKLNKFTGVLRATVSRIETLIITIQREFERADRQLMNASHLLSRNKTLAAAAATLRVLKPVKLLIHDMSIRAKTALQQIGRIKKGALRNKLVRQIRKELTAAKRIRIDYEVIERKARLRVKKLRRKVIKKQVVKAMKLATKRVRAVKKDQRRVENDLRKIRRLQKTGKVNATAAAALIRKLKPEFQRFRKDITVARTAMVGTLRMLRALPKSKANKRAAGVTRTLLKGMNAMANREKRDEVGALKTIALVKTTVARNIRVNASRTAALLRSASAGLNMTIAARNAARLALTRRAPTAPRLVAQFQTRLKGLRKLLKTAGEAAKGLPTAQRAPALRRLAALRRQSVELFTQWTRMSAAVKKLRTMRKTIKQTRFREVFGNSDDEKSLSDIDATLHTADLSMTEAAREVKTDQIDFAHNDLKIANHELARMTTYLESRMRMASTSPSMHTLLSQRLQQLRAMLERSQSIAQDIHRRREVLAKIRERTKTPAQKAVEKTMTVPAVHGEVVYTPRAMAPLSMTDATKAAEKLLESVKDLHV